MMESANWVPICFLCYDALDSPWVVPVPGLTGFAIGACRARNLLKLMSSAKPLSAYAASIGLVRCPSLRQICTLG